MPQLLPIYQLTCLNAGNFYSHSLSLQTVVLVGHPENLQSIITDYEKGRLASQICISGKLPLFF